MKWWLKVSETRKDIKMPKRWDYDTSLHMNQYVLRNDKVKRWQKDELVKQKEDKMMKRWKNNEW